MSKLQRVIDDEDIEEAQKYIEERSEFNPVTSCFLWKLSTTRHGYGCAKWKGLSIPAHRLSFAAWDDGVIPVSDVDNCGLIVRHSNKTCDKRCVNPIHLSIGTYKDSVKDRKNRGTLTKDELHPRTALNEAQATIIANSKFAKSDPRYKTQKERGSIFGVSEKVVRSIDNGVTWKNIKRPIIEEESLIKNENKKPRLIKPKKPSTFEWTPEYAKEAFEIVKSKCKYSEVQNEFIEGKCLEWSGGKLVHGRPKITVKGRKVNAYLFSCEYKYGRMKEKNEIICHKCNNPICCEPNHLVLGSYKDNTDDSLKFGKSKSFKINFEIAKKIRDSHSNEGVSIKDLAVLHGISARAVWNVINNKSWKD